MKFLSGVYQKTQFVEKTSNLIETFLEDITNNLINGIIGSSIFVNTTRGMIGLFIVISSILFLTGTLQITQRELIVRLFKAILIGVMLSPTSLGLLSSILPLAKDTANYVGNLLVTQHSVIQSE